MKRTLGSLHPAGLERCDHSLGDACSPVCRETATVRPKRGPAGPSRSLAGVGQGTDRAGRLTPSVATTLNDSRDEGNIPLADAFGDHPLRGLSELSRGARPTTEPSS